MTVFPSNAPPGSPAAATVGARALVLSALAFAWMGLFVKLAGERLPSQQIVTVRALISLMLTLALLRRAGVSPWGKNRVQLFLRGVFGFGGLSCFYYALVHLPLAEATVIQYTNPIFTAFLAALVLGEALTRRLGVALVLAFAGVVVIARPAGLFGAAAIDPFVVAVGFVGALLSACAYVLVRRLSRSEHELVIILYFPLVALPASLPGAFGVLSDGGNLVLPRGLDWIWLLGVGISAQAAQIWLTRGIRRLPAGAATAILYLQIVFATALGAMILGEIPDSWTLVGSVLVLSGTVLVARRRPRGSQAVQER